MARSRSAAAGLSANYIAAFAHQNDYAKNPLSISLNYYLGEAGLGFRGATAAVGYEVLEGNGTIGFSTPLATLHIFQGWADVFLTTPTAGIEDFYVKAGYGFSLAAVFSRVTATVVYHDFSAEQGDADFGSEWDAQIEAALNANVTLGVKYAAYRGAGPYPDKAIGWLYVGLPLLIRCAQALGDCPSQKQHSLSWPCHLRGKARIRAGTEFGWLKARSVRQRGCIGAIHPTPGRQQSRCRTLVRMRAFVPTDVKRNARQILQMTDEFSPNNTPKLTPPHPYQDRRRDRRHDSLAPGRQDGLSRRRVCGTSSAGNHQGGPRLHRAHRCVAADHRQGKRVLRQARRSGRRGQQAGVVGHHPRQSRAGCGEQRHRWRAHPHAAALSDEHGQGDAEQRAGADVSARAAQLRLPGDLAFERVQGSQGRVSTPLL